jgi:uncharacterized protein YjbI with pentapeptide repeats
MTQYNIQPLTTLPSIFPNYPDLSGTDLSLPYYPYALDGVDFSMTNHQQSILGKRYLEKADLSGAALSGANLRRANLDAIANVV